MFFRQQQSNSISLRLAPVFFRATLSPVTCGPRHESEEALGEAVFRLSDSCS